MVYLCSQCGGYHDPPRRKSSIADNADTISKQPPEGRRDAGTESDNLLNNMVNDVKAVRLQNEFPRKLLSRYLSSPLLFKAIGQVHCYDYGISMDALRAFNAFDVSDEVTRGCFTGRLLRQFATNFVNVLRLLKFCWHCIEGCQYTSMYPVSTKAIDMVHVTQYGYVFKNK